MVGPPENVVGQPAYEYRPVVKGMGKLFLGRKARHNVKEGTTLRVVVGPLGISWSVGDEMVVARWQDVPLVWQGITRRYVNGSYVGTDYRYVLRLADGRTKTFAGTERDGRKPPEQPGSAPSATLPITLAQLGNVIQQAVTSVQFPRSVQLINAGQAVSFGPLWISAAGIGHEDQGLRWDEVEEVKVHQGVVRVKKADKWLTWEKVPVAQVPNFFVFMDLVKALLARKAAQRPPGS